MTPTSPEPADVAFTRAVVGAVPSFRHAKDAGALLGTCVAFARWLVATNQALDPRTAFAPEHLDAYLAGPLAGRPQGSKDAAMSSCGAWPPPPERLDGDGGRCRDPSRRIR